ncbi:MAG: dihydrolipoyl dehydrogenase [Oscillospiraceae bacterium]|nr:dihydrolipoyl dehydrogenase [Oscillospiraceae bacterium]
MNKLNRKIAILGSGPAGYVAAIRASQLGASVALIEEKDIGGVCMNRGCIPTKALLRTSEIASFIKRSKEFGIDSHMDNINWNYALDLKSRIVKNNNIGIEQLLNAKGVTIIRGRGEVLSNHRIIVLTSEESIEITCEKMILATGSSPLLPNIKGIDSKGVITSDEALNLNVLPKDIIIIGAGVIGLEFATMFNSLGVKVTVIELLDRILPDQDSEISAELLKIMKRQGISFKLSASVKEIQKANVGLTVSYEQGEKTFTKSSEKVLIAVGRRLNSSLFQNLPLDIEKKAIVVDEYMETNIKGIYAAGDVTGGKLLAHLAFAEGKVAAENALGICTRVNYNAVPSCIYTNPEVASVGMTEDEATQLGILAKVGRFDLKNNSRALTLSERNGFVKVIADENNTIIGSQILGVNASEMISELTLAITLKAKASDLADMIHPHPTLSEAVWEACSDILKRAIHKL